MQKIAFQGDPDVTGHLPPGGNILPAARSIYLPLKPLANSVGRTKLRDSYDTATPSAAGIGEAGMACVKAMNTSCDFLSPWTIAQRLVSDAS